MIFGSFSFHVGLLLLSTFLLSNRTPKITRILTLYQANTATLTLFSKGDKILIKNLYECKRLTVYNKVAEQRLDEEQHQQPTGCW